MGFILITHDLSILAETCDTIAVMYAGKIVEKAASEDLFQHTAHPYTKKLINSFPNIEGEKAIPAGINRVPPNMLELPSGCPFWPRCECAGDNCREELPAGVEIAPGHYVACHRWEDILNES